MQIFGVLHEIVNNIKINISIITIANIIDNKIDFFNLILIFYDDLKISKK